MTDAHDEPRSDAEVGLSETPAETCTETLPEQPVSDAGTDAPAETQVSSRPSLDTIRSAVLCMVSFFTIIRIDVGQKEFDAMENNFWLVPVLGFINGLVAFMVVTILALCGVGTLLQAIAALVSMYVFSKFLHFDGLTDSGDGIVVTSGKHEDHIRALKDSLIGAGGFGVTLCVVLLTVGLYNQIGGISSHHLLGDSYVAMGIAMVAFCAEILVKNAQVAAAAFGEPGNGMASRQVRCTTTPSLMRSTILTVILLAVATLIGIGVANACSITAQYSASTVVLLFIVAVMMSIGIGYLMARKANRTFGFVNGDILGATNELSRAGILLVTVLLIGLLW
ncbi:MAG: adenosylcobinamide-GDP ribazoletransferase [archaeon]|nr:adenosylcobinamide-GDP ribazoletransferase [archaeon]